MNPQIECIVANSLKYVRNENYTVLNSHFWRICHFMSTAWDPINLEDIIEGPCVHKCRIVASDNEVDATSSPKKKSKKCKNQPKNPSSSVMATHNSTISNTMTTTTTTSMKSSKEMTSTTCAEVDLSDSQPSDIQHEHVQTYPHCKQMKNSPTQHSPADHTLFCNKKSLVWTFLVIVKGSNVLTKDGHLVSMLIKCGLCKAELSPTWKYKKSG